MTGEVTVIVPGSASWVQVNTCLAALFADAGDTPREVAFVSPTIHTSLPSLHSKPGWMPFRSMPVPAAGQFARGANLAVERSSAEWVVVLDPHAAPRSGWLSHLVRLARQRPQAGVISFAVADGEGRLLDDGAVPEPAEAGRDADLGCLGHVRALVTASRFGGLVPRTIWDELGGLDETYADALASLGDLALRARSAGYEVLREPRAVVTFAAAPVTVPGAGGGERPVPAVLDALRPRSAGAPARSGSARVLVLGFYRADRLTNVEDTAVELASSQHIVEQHWACLAGSPTSPEVARLSCRIARPGAQRPAYVTEMLRGVDMSAYDHLLLVEDPVVLPGNFVDDLLAWQAELGFAVVTPAVCGPAAWAMARRQPGLWFRETTMAARDPVVAFDRSVLAQAARFAGEGADCWTLEGAARLGIVDAVPVSLELRRHSWSPPGEIGWIAGLEACERGPEAARVLDTLAPEEAAR
ncbi:MAG: hypothetical protein KBD01_01870 [Acidobacteria bacterium]|nr:hypothetical protein [Acidobacteriota bacterium]